MKGELGFLPRSTHALLDATVVALNSVFGERLKAALLVGAAATPSREDRAREPEVLAIVENVSVPDLQSLAGQAQAAMRGGVHLRVLSRHELLASCDVFALEIAEWRDRHVLLAGQDPFGECRIERADLRRGVEAAWRGLGRRVKNRVLAGLATNGRRDDPERAVADGVNRVVALAHHSIKLAGQTPPTDEVELVAHFARLADAPAEGLMSELAALRTRGKVQGQGLEALIEFVEHAARWADTLPATE